MRLLLQATDGKVFTLSTMHLLIDYTRIREYRMPVKHPPGNCWRYELRVEIDLRLVAGDENPHLRRGKAAFAYWGRLSPKKIFSGVSGLMARARLNE